MINRNMIEAYQHLVLDKHAELERAKVLNAEYEKVAIKAQTLERLQDSCYRHLLKLEQLKKIIDKEDASFRERRITFLSEHITQELLKIFPAEGYTAKIDVDFLRGNGTATLTLIDKYGVERIPEITEGKLCQYLISFAATVGAVKGLGTNNIYVDEAFGVSSTDNLPKIGDMLNATVEEGMQLVLISQNAGLYSDIPRREICLELNSITDSAEVVEVIDF